MTRKPIPVIGRIDDTGEAREFPAVKLVGKGSPFIDCKACGERLDKRDLAAVLEHEQECRGRG